MARLRTRAIALVAISSLLPLCTLGAIAIQRAKRTLLEEAARTSTDLAQRAAGEIERQVDRFEELLAKLALVLTPSTRLAADQVERILKSYRIDTRELVALDYVREGGREWATSRLDGVTRDRGAEPAVRAALAGKIYRSPVYLSEDLVPRMDVAVPQLAGGQVVGAMLATIDLSEMWRVIDTLKVGERGYARVVGEDGTLVAIGDHALKRRVFTHERDRSGPIVERVLAGEKPRMRYPGQGGQEVLGVGWPIGKLGWGLILEQPVSEALATYYPFRNALFAIGAALLGVAALIAGLGARSVVRPIERLRLRAGEIARGLLDARVEIDSPEELAALAEAMNNMSADLIRLQEDLRKKERIATLGRLAAGLAHDLKHPIRALQVSAKNVVQKGEDPEVRRQFNEVVQREFKRLERFLEDLKRVSQGGSIEFSRDELDVNALVRDFAGELRSGGGPACVEVVVAQSEAPLFTVGNRELLGRVLQNLASNAFEAMEGEGQLTLSVGPIEIGGPGVELRVSDSGPGIPPERRQGLFSDFETTKRRGLGLGLAVCKKIVNDHGGTIAVADVADEGADGAAAVAGALGGQGARPRGATFVIRLPRAAAGDAGAHDRPADRDHAGNEAQGDEEGRR